ncbi:oligosaccharide flippase family protein, partial [Listeria booriae]
VFRMLRIVSIAIFVFLFLFADIIAMMMGDVALSELIRVISFVFLLMPYLAFMRGFFQSTGEMIPTAISQTIEQIIRVVIILLGAGLALNMGLDLYDAGAMAMSGAIFGGVSGIFVLRHFYNKRLASGQGLQPAVFTEKQEKVGIGRDFLRQSMAICVVSSMLILFQLVDSFQVYRLMSDSGIPDFIAKSLKGIYDRGQPILQLGLVL